MKAKVGRPTDYTKELVKKAKGYLATCVDQEEEGKIRANFPSAVGLAIHLGITRDTLYDWRLKHEEFSDILDDIQKEQEKRLLNRGLDGKYNSTITKLVLSKHGYVEKNETDITSKGESINLETKQKADKAIEIYLNGNNTGNNQEG